jgi:hypothetical protein
MGRKIKKSDDTLEEKPKEYVESVEDTAAIERIEKNFETSPIPTSDVSKIERNLFNEDKQEIYEEEKKVYKTLSSIRKLYTGAIQLGISKIAMRLKDVDNPEDLKLILEELRDYISAGELKELTLSCQKTLQNMQKLYNKDSTMIFTGGSVLKDLFKDL